jgi:phosphoglycolate phosphatase-like HAD superfamily hydrolase
LTDEELNSFFGPTLHQTFSRYSDDENEIKEMIDYYREFNIANHDSMVHAFTGVKEMVTTLYKRGYLLGVVSSKKDDLVNHGLELVGIHKMFDVVIGADKVKAHKPKPDGILMALEELEAVKAKRIEALANDKKSKILNFILGKKNPNKLNVKKACYVGDTLNDMLAAKTANIKTVAVLYKDNPEEMLEANPDYAISKPQELLKVCVE